MPDAPRLCSRGSAGLTVFDRDKGRSDDMIGTLTVPVCEHFETAGGWLNSEISDSFSLEESSRASEIPGDMAGEMAESEKQAAAKRRAAGDESPCGTISLRIRFAPTEDETAMATMEVICPPGVMAGQRVMVQGPDGPLAVALPQGLAIGQVFTVRIPKQIRSMTQQELVAEAKERVAAAKIQAMHRGNHVRKTKQHGSSGSVFSPNPNKDVLDRADDAVIMAQVAAYAGGAAVDAAECALDLAGDAASLGGDALSALGSAATDPNLLVDVVKVVGYVAKSPFYVLGAIIEAFV